LIFISQILAYQFTAIGLPEDRLTGNAKWVDRNELLELANENPINSIKASDLEGII
jgi:hypothetical protein